MSLFVNKNPAGKLRNIQFGFCCIADGLVMVLSLGWLKTTFQLDCARNHSRNYIKKLMLKEKEKGL